MNDELQKLLQQWQLSNVRSFAHIAMINNYVVIAYSAQYKSDVVLKVGPKKIIDKEIQTLQYFQGEACVKLLQFDCTYSDTNSALLLEHIQPGTSLKDLFLEGREEETIVIFADLVKRMHAHPKKYEFEEIQTAEQRLSLLHTFQSKNLRLTQLLPQVAKLADQLVASQGKQYLLHGDLHHENILKRKIDNISGEDKGRKPDEAESDVSVVVYRTESEDWVMIDPQGVVGELEYEVGAFIRNPLFELLDQQNLEQLMLHRFERLSQLLNLDKQRIIDWSFVQAVLGACYYEEDCQDESDEKTHDYWVELAELLMKL